MKADYMQKTEKEEEKKQRTQKRRKRSKKREKLPVVRRWVPSRNQRRVGDCCHRIISFSKNCLKHKKVCFFQYRPELIYRPKFNEIGWNGQNRPEWTKIQSEVERGGDLYWLSDWHRIFWLFRLVRNKINNNAKNTKKEFSRTLVLQDFKPQVGNLNFS